MDASHANLAVNPWGHTYSGLGIINKSVPKGMKTCGHAHNGYRCRLIFLAKAGIGFLR